MLLAGGGLIGLSTAMFLAQHGIPSLAVERLRGSSPLPRGAELLEGHEVIGVEQDADGVTVAIQDTDNGKRRRLCGKYLIGADGAHSKVRELLGIPFDGRGVFSNSITIYFRADLTPQLLGKALSVIYINNPTLGGFFRMEKNCTTGFPAVNTVGDPKVDPRAAADAATDISEKRLIELVRAGVGVPDLAVKIDGIARWRATSDVARQFRVGRIFLAGDAAHLMPPNGGFGGNTGIHDAHNLAWKLAMVLRGAAGPELLETYELERKPVSKFTVEQAYTRYVTRTATYLGANDFQPPAHDFNIELGYLYRSPAILRENGQDKGDQDGGHDDPRHTFGRPGSRAPHVWLNRGGQKVSTIDLFGRSYVLLANIEGTAWCHAARVAASRFKGLDLETYCVGTAPLRDPDLRFAEAYGLPGSGAALVRPDGFVAWRAKSLANDAEEALTRAFGALLMTSNRAYANVRA